MTIQGSINIALSSLNLMQQQSSMISTNIANASTAGYAQRDVIGGEFRSGGFGSGVVATEVRSLANQTAAQAANQASSALAFSQRMVGVLQPYGQQLGQPTDITSLSSRLSALDSALVTLSATPADASAQAKVVNTARALTETLHGLSETIASARQEADRGIATAVDDVNETLHALERNETSRMAAASNGQPTASFDSTREKLLADLSESVPVSVQRNGDNSIVVTTDRGSTLWDGAVHELSFDATPVIPSTMAAKADAERGLSGGLSGVTVDGQPIAMSRQGSIAANLELRDSTLPGFGDQLDRIAGNLIATFQSTDPTVEDGETGIFTDAGDPLDPSDASAIAGLAGRIDLNPSVDPDQGGQVWRVRDGAQAGTPGSASATALIMGFSDALQSAASSTAIAGLPRSASLMEATMQVAGMQTSAMSTWSGLNEARAQQAEDTQTALSSATGVNIDDQMQRLLIVQQTYAASAQVVRAASGMMDALMSALR